MVKSTPRNKNKRLRPGARKTPKQVITKRRRLNPKHHQKRGLRKRGVVKDARAQTVIDGYRNRLQTYKSTHKDAFEAMMKSRSVETDGHVAEFLCTLSLLNDDVPPDEMGISPITFEDDILFMVRFVWRNVIARVKPEDDTRPLLSVGGVLKRLRDDMSPALLESIDKLKESVTRYHPEGRTCSVMLCSAKGTKTMNSLHYCGNHFGLALFNGMRHDCNVCHVWHVLCLRHATTGGHLYNTATYLIVPLHDKGVQHGNMNIRLKRFCQPGTKGGGEPSFVGTRGPRPSYSKTAKENRLVPANSFCYLNRYGRAEAWINLEIKDLRTDIWKPVTTHKRYHDILEQLGWTDEWGRPPFCKRNDTPSNGWSSQNEDSMGWG